MERKLINPKIYDSLPTELQVLTKDFQGFERDVVLLSSIGVLSCCLPNVYGKYDNKIVYPHLYIMIIAPAASGKGVMNYSRKFIERIDTNVTTISKSQNSVQLKIVPANISSAELHRYLESSTHGMIMIESEADTLGIMLKNDWSNFSDLLRKAFHHEPISLARKTDKLLLKIPEPKLSLVISGTPDQLLGIIKSTKNGIFSRFLIYNFDEISPFKNVFSPSKNEINLPIDEIENSIYNLYGRLFELKNQIEFKFSEKQSEIATNFFNNHQEKILYENSADFVANIKRHGLILFRICMILTSLRNINTISTKKEITCSNQDFLIGLRLIKSLIGHSKHTFDEYSTNLFTYQDEELFDSLPNTFSRHEAIEHGKLHDIPQRTMDYKLDKWISNKIIIRVMKGKYKKA